MTATASKTSRRNPLLDVLSADYAVFRDCLPLALGIHKTVKERKPDLEAPALRSAMRIHTASTRYLKALVTGKERFDLDGQVAGEVTEEQREVASAALLERFKKAAERRKAEEQAKKAGLKAEEAAKKEALAAAQRQEKLAELAARFSKR
jgi:ProP effector